MHDNENPIPAPKRVPWNKGKLIGPRPPLQQRHVWAIRTRLRSGTRSAILRCLIWGSIASCAAVTLSLSGSTMSPPMVPLSSGQPCGRKRPGGRCGSSLTEQTRQAIDEYLAATGRKPGEYLFGGQETWVKQ